jgi:uncharacterized protein YgiM (DUF1202 family)
MKTQFFPLRRGIILILFVFIVSCAPGATAIPTDNPANAQNATATPIPEVVVGVVVVDTLNVREGPGTSYPIVRSLAKGEKFQILGEVTNNTSNKWLLIDPSTGSFGWVIGDQSYVTIQHETVDLATYLNWQKNVDNSKSLLVISTASP